jgi:PPK2 family polyphosphate:nucleotide phosphotransferase
MKKDQQKRINKLMDRLIAEPGKKISLKDYDADWTGSIKDKKEAALLLEDGVKELAKQQDRLYAQDTYSLLMVFQAMDAAGKDGTIRHVMSGINPQGCQVYSFKAPSAEERDHDYLWRSMKALPERGRIGIHNRSYYEEVLVARVHPEILASQQLPADCKDKGVWKSRFEQINNFERYLHDNGTRILKFYLNVSKKEQKKRFLERIDQQEKNWKFSVNDAKERSFWKDYMNAYEDVFTHTSTKYAPWYIIPADNKWFMRLAVAAITYRTLDKLDLKYPTLTAEKKQGLVEAKKVLLAEKA